MQLLRGRSTDRLYADGVIFGSSYDAVAPLRALRFLAIGTLLIILTASASALALNKDRFIAPSTTAGAVVAAIPTNTTPPPTPAPALTPPSSAATDTASGCHRGTYSLPSELPLANKPSGVYIQVDTPATYQVHGNNSGTIMQQIADCTPVRSGGLFAANTGYSLSSAYMYGVGSDGLCRITTAVVTLHVNQVFPAWSSSSASPRMSADWTNFIANLRTHEQGHVDLDKSYAHKLYEVITTTAPQNCNSFKVNVDSASQTVTNNLAAANDNYDAITNHGTTQGAVL